MSCVHSTMDGFEWTLSLKEKRIRVLLFQCFFLGVFAKNTADFDIV